MQFGEGQKEKMATYCSWDRPKACATTCLAHRKSLKLSQAVEHTVERTPHMETVQIVIDKELLRAADQAARRTKRNRSALIRDALREHLRRLRVREAEERDRAGYDRRPQAKESLTWEAEALWPAE
jgi:hypothetical protein